MRGTETRAPPCDCICDEHANFEAARDLAMRRYYAIVALQREHDELADERDEWRERAQAAEQRLRDIEGIAEGHINCYVDALAEDLGD